MATEFPTGGSSEKVEIPVHPQSELKKFFLENKFFRFSALLARNGIVGNCSAGLSGAGGDLL